MQAAESTQDRPDGIAMSRPRTPLKHGRGTVVVSRILGLTLALATILIAIGATAVVVKSGLPAGAPDALRWGDLSVYVAGDVVSAERVTFDASDAASPVLRHELEIKIPEGEDPGIIVIAFSGAAMLADKPAVSGGNTVAWYPYQPNTLSPTDTAAPTTRPPGANSSQTAPRNSENRPQQERISSPPRDNPDVTTEAIAPRDTVTATVTLTADWPHQILFIRPECRHSNTNAAMQEPCTTADITIWGALSHPFAMPHGARTYVHLPFISPPEVCTALDSERDGGIEAGVSTSGISDLLHRCDLTETTAGVETVVTGLPSFARLDSAFPQPARHGHDQRPDSFVWDMSDGRSMVSATVVDQARESSFEVWMFVAGAALGFSPILGNGAMRLLRRGRRFL